VAASFHETDTEDLVSGFLRYVAVSGAILLVSATSCFAAADNSRLREISDSVYSFTLGEGNYSMFVIGENAVAVFDTFDSRHSTAMLDAIRSVTDKPIRYAFHSHNHLGPCQWGTGLQGRRCTNSDACACC